MNMFNLSRLTPKKLIGGGMTGLGVYGSYSTVKTMLGSTSSFAGTKAMYPTKSGIASRGRYGRNTNPQPNALSGVKFNFRKY